MEKISLDELRSILKELGHSDEEIESVIKSKSEEEEGKDEDKKESEEKVESEVEIDEKPEEGVDGEGEGEPAPEGTEPSPVETAPAEGEVEVEPEVPAPEGEVVPEPEAAPAEGEPLPEGAEEINPEAPAVEEVPPAPAAPEVDVQSLVGKIEEYEKANAGLMSRVEALESALKEAGVLGEGSLPSKEIGVDDGSRVNDYHDDETTFDSVINEINRGY